MLGRKEHDHLRPFLIIKDHYARIKQLADEKSVLARRVVDFIPRTRTRPNHDLSRGLRWEDSNAPTVSAAFTVSLPSYSTVQEHRDSENASGDHTCSIHGPRPAQVAGNRSKVFRRRFFTLALMLRTGRRAAGGIMTSSISYGNPTPSTAGTTLDPELNTPHVSHSTIPFASPTDAFCRSRRRWRV